MTEFSFHNIPGDHASYWINDFRRLARMCDRASVAVDIETKGLGERSWSMTAVSVGTANEAVVLDPGLPGAADCIRAALSSASELVLHNSSYDVPILISNGFMDLADVAKVWDTVILARQAAPGERVSKSLGAASERHLGLGYATFKTDLERYFKLQTGVTKADMFSQLGFFSPAFLLYAAYDVVMTARLRAALPGAIDTWTNDNVLHRNRPVDVAHLIEREQIVNRLLLRRNAIGIELDTEVLDQLAVETVVIMAEADEILTGWGVDLSQGREKIKQAVMAELDRRGLLPASHKRLANGQPSADKRYLSRIQHPVLDALEARSQAGRFLSDYGTKMEGLAHQGRIHPQVQVAVATTGRMSVGDPPIQQYPAKVRRMLRFDVPSTSLDWSSIEPVFFANVCGEIGLVEQFESGGDVYQPIADLAGVDRKTAKVILLAQLYGQGTASLATRLEISEEAATDLRGRVLGELPRIRTVSRKVMAVADTYGLVETVSGRVIPLDADPTTGNQRFYGYKGVNALVQGSCYDLLAEALFAMHEQGLGDALQFAIHDELVVATEAADDVDKIMRTPPEDFIRMAGRTPLLRTGRYDMGRNWQKDEG